MFTNQKETKQRGKVESERKKKPKIGTEDAASQGVTNKTKSIN